MDDLQHLHSDTPGRALLVTLWAILVFMLNVFSSVVRCFERYVFPRPETKADSKHPLGVSSEAQSLPEGASANPVCSGSLHIGDLPSKSELNPSSSTRVPGYPKNNMADKRVLKYYVVRRGFRRGIYTSWSKCEEMVRGFSGAVFKSFRTRDEAEEFLR